jgi:hypothetical protein
MYGVCTSCPGAETLKVLLHNELDDMKMEYKQCIMTHRATLMTVTQQNLVSKIPELNHHHTAKQQARYLKESEENVHSDQCIILADFSENYSFILQDAIKGFLLGKQSSNSSSFSYLYQRSTPAKFVLLCN